MPWRVPTRPEIASVPFGSNLAAHRRGSRVGGRAARGQEGRATQADDPPAAHRRWPRWALSSTPDYAAYPAFVAELTRAGAAAAVLALLLGLAAMPESRQVFDARVTDALVLAYAVVTAWLVQGAIRAPENLRYLRGAGVAAYVLIAVYAVAGDPIAPTHLYHPITTGLIIGAAAFTGGFGPLLGSLGAIGLAIAVAIQRTLSMPGEQQGLIEGVLFGATQVVGAALISTLIAASAAVVSAEQTLAEAEARDRYAQTWVSAQRQVDNLIHNYVLTALLVTARAHSRSDQDAAQALAAQAADTIDGIDPSVGPWAQRVREQAGRLGLDLSLKVKGVPHDPAAAGALLDAVIEALANVRKHSGVNQVQIGATFTAHRSSASIADSGDGFDPHTVPSGRHGIQRSIRARIEELGGCAELRTHEGTGTLWQLSIPRRRPVETPVETPNTFRDVSIVLPVTIALACDLLIAHGYRSVQAAPVIPVLAIVLVLLVAWLLSLPNGSRWWLPAVGVWLAAILYAAFNTQDVGVGDWRTWFIGFFDPVVALIAFRFAPRAAILLVLVMCGIYVVTLTSRGESVGVFGAVSSWSQLLVWAVIGTHARRAFHGSTRQTLAYQQRTRERDDAVRLAQIQGQAIGSRLEVLNERVGPLLRRIAVAPSVDSDLRAEAKVTEAGLRDRLRNPALVDDDLLDLLDQARGRGVLVDLLAEDCPPSMLRFLRAGVANLLPQLQSHDQATVSVVTGADKQTGRIVVVPNDPQRTLVVDVALLPGRCRVDQPEGCLILTSLE